MEERIFVATNTHASNEVGMARRVKAIPTISANQVPFPHPLNGPKNPRSFDSTLLLAKKSATGSHQRIRAIEHR